ARGSGSSSVKTITWVRSPATGCAARSTDRGPGGRRASQADGRACHASRLALDLPTWQAPGFHLHFREPAMEFHIENMTCDGCARGVTRAIQSVDANATVLADPPSRTVKVATSATRERVELALVEADFPPRAA